MKKQLYWSAAGLLLATVMRSHAQAPAAVDTANTGLEEVVVTAQKRSENLHDVPIAISVFSADDLKDQRVGNLADLNNLAPNLRITNADAAANPKIFIRASV